MDIFVSLVAFFFVTAASKEIGERLTRFNLPLISGYLIAGIIAGPFVLDFVHKETVSRLRFIDELSLAFIAFAAGSEIYLEEIRSRYRVIAWHTIGQLIAVFGIGSAAFYLFADHIPIMQDLPAASRLAVAVLASAILLARSPSSAIAIVAELRAKGPFTKMLLGVTVVADVVVVIVFAFSASIADVLLTAEAFNLGFVVLLAAELTLSFVLGYLLGRLLSLVLGSQLHFYTKTTLVLLMGYAVFWASAWMRDFTHANLPFEVLFEPLLVTMVGSFWLTNFSRYRDEFLHLLEFVAPVIYVIFFTLVGDALELDILVDIWPIAILIFTLRMVLMLVGSFAGGVLARDPMNFNRLAWMGYITQAGVGLGLAKQVADEFPVFGDEFATMMIASIVLSQLVGPPLFKYAVRAVGEAQTPHHPDAQRDVLILGVGGQSYALARELQAQEWSVCVADIDTTGMERFDGTEMRLCHLPELSHETLLELVTPETDAVVAMMLDDTANYKACEIISQHYAVPRMIVRLTDYAWADRFHSLGVTVIYPASAVVSLISQFVRAPQSAAMLLQDIGDYQITQITITEQDVDGVPLRNLRLPTDVLVLGIMRDGYSIVPHGHTVLRQGDDVTLIGGDQSLAEVKYRLGY